MARQRNHQLKVYNQFNAGEQNIPADHLINNNAFSRGVNFDLTDSTLRPIREDKQLPNPTILPETKAYIQENIKGEDTDLQFDTEIDYINYADTVYYIEDTDSGSPLMQINPKDNTKVPALPTLSGELVVSNADSIDTGIKEEYDKVGTALTNFETKVSLAISEQSTTTAMGISNPLLNNLKARASVFTNPPSGITLDTYKEILDTGKEQLKDLTDRISTYIAETEGDLVARIKSAIADQRYAYSLIRNPVLDTAPPESHGGTDAYRWSYINVNRHAELERNLEYELSLVAYLGRYSGVLANFVEEFTTNSIYGYYGISFKTFNTESKDVYRATLKSIREEAFTAKRILDKLAPLELGTQIDWLDNIDTHIANVLNILTRDEVNLVVDIVKGLCLAVASSNNNDRFFGWLSGKYHTITLSEANTRMQTLHTELKAFRDAVDEVSIEDNILGNISEYSVVGHNTDTGAYTNMIRSDEVYDKNGLTLTFTENGLDEYLIYRRKSTEGSEFQLVKTVTSSPVVLTTPYPKFGAVPVLPYRIKEPHNDYTTIAEYKGAIFLNRKESQEIYYTSPNNPHDMKATSFIKMPQDVKAMKSAGSGLFIWTTNNALYLLTGSPRSVQNENTLSIKLVGEGVDIIDKNSVTSQDSLVVWLSDYAIHNTSGYGSADATKYVWKPPKIDKVIQSLVFKNKIYFLCKEGGSNFLIEYDTSRKATTRISTEVQSLSIIGTQLVGLRTGDSKPYALFEGTDLKEYDVSLKRYSGYSYDVRQVFSNISIFHTPRPYADIPPNLADKSTVTVYIDDARVQTQELQGLGATRIVIPTMNAIGYSLRIDIKGKLGIKSARVRYTTKDWED